MDNRIWVDGCFDFTHHGHAGALMQARQFGTELFVGVHSDEEIAANKGPVVMHLPERVIAVESCKWVTKAVPNAPYVTDPKVMDEFGCRYVVHGDDITTDADGNDCYQQVKDDGRFLVVKRTPNISTTDLIQRMLSSSKAHHFAPLSAANPDHPLLSSGSVDRFEHYATDETAKAPWAGVYAVVDGVELKTLVKPGEKVKQTLSSKAFYVDGGFDLFYTGHMEFLAAVHKRAQADGAAVVVGIHDDTTVNQAKDENYPIMSLFERALCVLQCRYVDAIVLGAPFQPTELFLELLKTNGLEVVRVLHGATPVITAGHQVDLVDPYTWAKQQQIYEIVPRGEYSDMTTRSIVDRVLTFRRVYEERQRKKGVKAINERRLKDGEVA